MEPESRRSCCSRFIWCGIPVEKGCLIFSIINAIVVSISLVGCFVYIGWLIDIKLHPEKLEHMEKLELVLYQLLCLILTVFTGISFIHAVMLCCGAHKEKPGFLMVYFVYGIAVEFIVVSGTIALFAVGAIHYVIVLILISLIVGYAFILALVHRAYIAMTRTTLRRGHKKLRDQYPAL